MKIAVISANFGGFDTVNPFPEQTIPCERLYFNEANTPYPLASLRNRMKGKFFKMQSHKFLKQYEVFIWIDANVKVTSDKFVQHILEPLTSNDVSIQKHPHRSSIYEELAFIQDSIEKGSKYLKSRYDIDSLIDEVDDIGPGIEGLYACGIFARLNTPKVNEMFDYWWEQQFLFNDFDQIRFVEVAQALNVGTVEFGNFYKNQFYELTTHKVVA